MAVKVDVQHGTTLEKWIELMRLSCIVITFVSSFERIDPVSPATCSRYVAMPK